MMNHIDRLKNEEDRWCQEKDAIQGIIQRYFHTIFSSSNPSNDELEKVISAVPAQVTEDMNRELLIEYSAQEVVLPLSALRNLIYKLVPKPIANRLEPLLDSIISPFQSAFILGRLITDNVLVAFKVNHFLKNKRGGRGIRQGDPLSPYLFIICAKALNCLLQFYEIKGSIRGVAIARSAPKVSHLLFADDTLIFCQAS
ncbi:UNVERIFIED_CONTAM: putative mitochondrial protein [Sesamum angustifolium]|uniref:Mitochondrial protein n=1 Tax=Sesamum angustifolium TaxID=2727405 RepID=A0AAW2J6R7_9LAMI